MEVYWAGSRNLTIINKINKARINREKHTQKKKKDFEKSEYYHYLKSTKSLLVNHLQRRPPLSPSDIKEFVSASHLSSTRLPDPIYTSLLVHR